MFVAAPCRVIRMLFRGKSGRVCDCDRPSACGLTSPMTMTILTAYQMGSFVIFILRQFAGKGFSFIHVC